MVDMGRVRSTVRPEAKTIDDYSVWVNTDIQEVSVTCDGESHVEYEYHQVRYTKDEYMGLLDSKNEELERQLTDMQVALCEVYEQTI